MYFDLRTREIQGALKKQGERQRQKKTLDAEAQSGVKKVDDPLPPRSQLFIWLALFLGIAAKQLINWLEKNEFNWTRLIAAIVGSILMFPEAYRQAMNANASGSPFAVQLAVVFTTGFGFKSLTDIEGGTESSAA